MRWTQTLTMVEAHAEGEIGRCITGGMLDVPCDTMLEKMTHLNTVDDSLRRFCTLEPRGFAQMSTNLLLPPSNPKADAGMIVMQADQAHAFSGSNGICVVTVLLETGMVAMCEPESIVRLDTPAGLVVARAQCRDGKCESVTLRMPPGFLEAPGVEVDVPVLGRIAVDVAFGGVYYGFVDPGQIGLEITPNSARALVDAGCRIHRALNGTVRVRHPELPAIDRLSYVMFVDRTESGELLGATILPPGRVDRSPCGTGNVARLAVRRARGEVEPGEVATAYSTVGSCFRVALIGDTVVGDRPAVCAEISGRGWIHGIHQIGLDPSDPYPDGFMVSDCWGDAFDLVD